VGILKDQGVREWQEKQMKGHGTIYNETPSECTGNMSRIPAPFLSKELLWAGFYITLFIIRPWEQLLPVLGPLHFERFYAIILIVLTLLSRPGKVRFATSQTMAVIFFLLALGLSGLFAYNSSLAWEPFYEYTTLVIFYFILLKVIRTPSDLLFISIVYIGSMCIYLGKAQWEFFVHGQHQYDMGVVRLIGIESTFGGPNSLAMSIAASLPFLGFLWSKRHDLSLWSPLMKKWFKRGLVVYFVLAISSIVLTNSRSGMLSAVLYLALVALSGKNFLKKIGYIFAGIAFLSILWLVIPTENKDRFSTIWDKEAGPESATVSAEGRIEGMKAGLTMFERFPVTGVGIGSFKQYRINHVDGSGLSAHSLIGQLLGETGLVGGISFFFVVVITLKNARRIRRLARMQDDKILDALAGLASAIILSVMILLFDGLFGHNVRRFNWLWLAAFSSLAVQFAVQRGREIGQQDVYGTVVPTFKQ